MHDIKSFRACLHGPDRRSAFNLGYKLTSIIFGRTKPSILETYDSEHRRIARELIAFDPKFSQLLSERPCLKDLDETGVDLHTL